MTNSIKMKKRKTYRTFALFVTCLFVANHAFAQTEKATDYFNHLPKDIKLDNAPRSYKMTVMGLD